MNIEKLYRYVEPMDIILLSGKGLLSKIIKYGQKPQTRNGEPSLWSHCMLWAGHGTVIESTIDFKPYGDAKRRLDNGVQFNHINNYVFTKTALLMRFNLTQEQRDKMMVKAKDLVGMTYPIGGLVGSLLSFWIFRGWSSNPLQSKRSLYCSAFIQEVYKAVDIDFDVHHTSRNTSPEMVSQYDGPEEVKKIWLI